MRGVGICLYLSLAGILHELPNTSKTKFLIWSMMVIITTPSFQDVGDGIRQSMQQLVQCLVHSVLWVVMALTFFIITPGYIGNVLLLPTCNRNLYNWFTK